MLKGGFHIAYGPKIVGNTHLAECGEGICTCVSQKGGNIELHEVAAIMGDSTGDNPESLLLQAEQEGRWSFV